MTYTFKLSRRLAVARIAGWMLCPFLLTSCAPGELREGLGPEDPSLDIATLVIIPKTAVVEVNQPLQFQAYGLTGTGDSVAVDMEWSAENGDISANGLFVSSTIGSAKVRGSGNGRGKAKGRARKDSSGVEVVPQPPPDLEAIIVSPSSTALNASESRQFSAEGRLSDGSTVPIGVSWSATGGTIDPGGYYTAGSTSGSYAATATHAGTQLSGSATIRITTPGSGPVIAVVPTVALQTMTGWEATAQVGQEECNPVAFSAYRNAVYDRAVEELGINRLRLAIFSGTENPVDYFTEYLAGRISRDEWRARRSETINDNADPTAAVLARFQFAQLDHTIDHVVTPVRDRLSARGEHLYVNLNPVDFNAAGPLLYRNAPAEYAELILTTFQHLQSRYGWTPDAVEIVLEPDNAGWAGTQIGNALVATGDRLAAAGYRPDFIAPSNANMSGAVTYFDQLVAVPRVTQYLTDLAYHRYGGVSDGNLQAIGARAMAHGIRTSMLEHIGSGYQDLHKDLTLGRNSAWQQFTLAYCVATDNGAQYFPVDISTPTAPVVQTGNRTKFLQQYFRHVRLGAVRHEATSTSGTFEPLAFRNPDGRWVVVVNANAGGTFSVTGLPAGTYGLTYTTPAAYRTPHPDVTLGPNQPLVTSIPASGVLTIAAQ